MNSNEFKRHGYAFIDWAAEYFDKVHQQPVCPAVRPGDIKNSLPATPPASAESMEEILADFRRIIMPGMTHWQHPSWFAYFPANNSPASVLAELLTATVGAQCMIWKTSPAAEELEEVVMDWLRQMLELPDCMVGVIQDTASTATLCAVLTAREVASGFSCNENGVKQPLTVYASEEAHSSVEKAVKIAGFGRSNLRLIETDSNLSLRPDVLRQAIETDKANGAIPACVIGTIGTTSSAAVDPIAAMGEICQEHGIWLHVDAAYAGSAALLPEQKANFAGLEYMDSLVFNPHKWLAVNFDCSAYFVKDPSLLKQTFALAPEYLKTEHDAMVNNYRDWGIQLGRRFRALKLWFVIRNFGVAGLQAMIREHITLARTFAQWIQKSERFQLLAPVHFSLVCFRLRPRKRGADATDLNTKLLHRVNRSGRVFLTHTSLKGTYAIRLAVGQRTTTKAHLEQAWTLIQQEAKLLDD